MDAALGKYRVREGPQCRRVRVVFSPPYTLPITRKSLDLELLFAGWSRKLYVNGKLLVYFLSIFQRSNRSPTDVADGTRH